jgi:hypothetical protein
MGDGSTFASPTVNTAEAIAAANDGDLSLWFPDGFETDRQRRTLDAYAEELSTLLSVPVQTESFRTDGGRPIRPARPDLLVRRGSDDRLHDALFEERHVPTPGCTTVTVYPHESRRPSFGRRLLERLSF